MVVDSKVDTLHHATVYKCVHEKVIPASLDVYKRQVEEQEEEHHT